jgi:peroxiredoxin family protein
MVQLLLNTQQNACGWADNLNQNKEACMDIKNIESQLAELKSQVDSLKQDVAEDKVTIAVFSGELDKLMSAFTIAIGAVAMGMEVVMYFTFWAIPVLRSQKKVTADKERIEKILGANLPRGVGDVKLSKMNPGGIDTSGLKLLMEKKNILSLEQMLSMAAEMGVRIYVSDKSTELLGFRREEFIDYPGLEYAGVATFLHEAQSSRVQLFI